MTSSDPRTLLAHALLPRLAAGALSPRWARFVTRRLESDAVLATAYDAVRRAERSAADENVELSAGQMDLLEGLILDSVEREAVQTSHRSLRLPAASGVLAAAALVGFVLTSSQDDGSFGVGNLAARGEKLGREPLGVKISCVVGETVTDSAVAGARQSGDILTCQKGGLLAFSATNLGAEERHVFVVGVAPDGSRRWLAPFEKEARAHAVAPGQVDSVLPTLADTSAFDSGPMALFVLFSDEPFAATDLERQLQASQRRGLALGSLDRLPIPVPVQGRIELAR